MATAISKPEEEDTSDDSGCEYLSNGILYHNICDDGGGVPHEPRLYIFVRYSKS
jgi:hypothetical protein